jgi:subtilisin family serine protease
MGRNTMTLHRFSMTLHRFCRLLSYALIALSYTSVAVLLQACADTKSLQEISNASVPDSSQLIIVNVRKPATGAWQMGSGGKPYGTAGGYDIPLQSIETMAAIASDYQLSRVDGWPIEALGFYCEVLRVHDGFDVADVVTKLKRDPRVAQVQRLNHFNTLTADNDPYFHVQYPGFRDALSRVHEHYAGEGVDIVVIDTGVDITHPDLKKNIASARNFIDADNEQFVRDIHGTAVSGIIGAEANNNIGIVGIAPKSRLHVFKACHQQANNVAAGCNSFGLARALASAIAIKPDIVNLSLTGPDDELLSLLIAKLISADTLVIAAVDDAQADGGFPASVQGVIAASAVMHSGGKTISAPAAEEISTRPHAAYDFYSGSSIAAAYVSGVAALLRQAYPQTARSTLADWLQTDSTVPCPFRDLFVAGVNEATSCK